MPTPLPDLERCKARLTYAQAVLDGEHQRFKDCEDKVMRYLTVLGVVVSAIAIGVDRFKTIVAEPITERQVAFTICYGLTFLLACGALVCVVGTLRVQGLPGPSTHPTVMDAFTEPKYELARTLRALSRRYEEAVHRAREINAKRYRFARWAFRLLVGAIVTALVSLVAYVVMPTPTEGADAGVTISVR